MLHIEKVFEDMARGLASHEIQFRADWGADGHALVVTAPELDKSHVLVEPPSKMLRGVLTMNARKWVRKLRLLRDEAAKRAAMNGAARAAEAPKPDDGEPRITDIELAQFLEWGIPRNIRAALIAPHREDLEALAHLRSEPINTTGKGGRPGTRYFLTREQALLICALSRGEKARQARQRVIDVFSRLNAERRTPKPDSAHDKADDPAERFEAIEKRLWVIERTLQKVHGAGRTVIDGFGTHIAGLKDEMAQVNARLARVAELVHSRPVDPLPEKRVLDDMWSWLDKIRQHK